MGLMYTGMPTDLIQELASQHQLDFFVETGTFEGNSLAEARRIFPTCYSIEIVEEYYRKALDRFEGDDGVHLLLGSSADKLKDIDYSQTSSALFWLDAHYSGGTTGGKDDCPLLEEIKHIASVPIDKYILIDDARFILCPWQEERYCQIEDLFAILPTENYNVIINDVLISVPEKAHKIVDEYCLRHTESAYQRKIKSKRVRALVKKVVGDL